MRISILIHLIITFVILITNIYADTDANSDTNADANADANADVDADADADANQNPDPNFHIYLAFGQSNMEGQATIREREKTVDERFKMIATVDGCSNRTLGEWYEALPPLAHCNNKAGIIDYFGRKYIQLVPKEIKVGVAVVAVSGANILLFDKDKYEEYVELVQYHWYQTIMNDYGRNPYGRLIEIGKKAQEVGVIKGIFLHQGENNISTEEWPDYVKVIYENILEDLNLNAEEVPLLVGEMVRTDMCGRAGAFNEIINRVPQVIPNSYVISAEGLTAKDDCVHFSNESFVEFGERFANKMVKLINGDYSDDNYSYNNDTSSSSSSSIMSYLNFNSLIFGLLIIIISIMF